MLGLRKSGPNEGLMKSFNPIAAQIYTERLGPQAFAETDRTHGLREERFSTEPVTLWAGAIRAIERKQSGFDFRKRCAVLRTNEFGRERLEGAVGVLYLDQTVGLFKRELEGLGEPLARRARILSKFRDEDAVHHRVDVVTLVTIEDYLLPERLGLAIHHHTLVTLAEQVVEELVILALAAHDYRRIDSNRTLIYHHSHYISLVLHSFSGVESGIPLLHARENHFYHLFFRQPDDGHVVMDAIGLTGPRVEHAQVVVNFGHGGHRRARGVGTALLVYGDGGGE